MNLGKYASVMVVAVMAASLGAVGCKSGGSKKSSSSSGTAATPASTASTLVQKAGGFLIPALIRSGLRPATVTTVQCPTSGNMSVDDTNVTFGGNGTTNATVGGNIGVTLNSCVASGYTFGGGWTENFSITVTASPDLTNPTSVTVNGNVQVPSGTITVSGNGINQSCSMAVTETFNITVSNPTSQTPSVSGTLTFDATVCGVHSTGSCNFTTGTCTAS